MNRQTSTLAIILGIWALAGRPVPLAQAEDVARDTDRSQVETREDATQLDRTTSSETSAKGQDNLEILPPGDGDIELVIRMLSEIWDPNFRNVEPTYSDQSLGFIADDINDAYKAGDFARVITLVNDNPEVAQARPEVKVLEAWSEHRLGQYAAALEDFTALYAAEPSPSNASGVLYAGLNGERFTKVFAMAEADTGPLGQILIHGREAGLPEPTQTEIKKVRVDFLTRWLAAAFKYNQGATVERVNALLAQEGVTPKVGPQLLAMGWRAYNGKNYADATRFFASSKTGGGLSRNQLVEADYGRALTLRAQGDNDGALAIAKTDEDIHSGMAELAAIIRAEQAPKAPEPEAPASEPVAVLPNEETSEPEPWVMSAAERATYRGHYLLAAADDPARYGKLTETGIAWIGDTLRILSRDGDIGLSELTIISNKFGAAWTAGLSHFKMELELMNLDAGGVPDINRPVGSWLPGDPPTAIAYTNEDDVVVPHLAWWREGDVALFGELGMSPMGGEVDPTVTGRLGADIYSGAAKTHLEAYRTPVYESILSTSGALDPATGEAFGGVVESGVLASYFGPVSDKWNISASGSWGERTGENVADNGHVKAALGLSYNVEAPGFAYLSIGPSYRYESYDKNLSQFTLGHGGYYSPQELHNLGLALNFMTEEGRDWLIKGDASVGAQSAKQEASPFYPLMPLPQANNYAGDDTSGLGIQGQVQGVRRLSDRWMVEAGAYGQNNNDFTEIGVFFKLRFNFGARSATYASDLTEPIYREW